MKKVNQLAKIVVVAVMALCSMSVVHADIETVDGIEWTYTVTDGVTTLTDIPNGTTGDITIPNTLGGYPVTSIGSRAFCMCSGLTSVRIPDSVTSIGDSAFSFCESLTSITIPNSVTNIGMSAFSNCYVLKSVTIPESVTRIENSLFHLCYDLTSVAIPDSVTSIGSSAFGGCSGLTSITIPNSVTNIGMSAFSSCESLTSVTIGDSVTSIGSSAFMYCSSLTSITIPDSVTSIENNPFDDTGYWNNQPNGVVVLDGWVLGVKGTCPSVVELSEGTRCIADYAFDGCSGLTSITISDSVTSIGDSAFGGCSGLTSITIPDSVTSIGYSAFYKCSGLTSVTIGDGVTSIGSSAFYGCSGLKSLTIGSGISSTSNLPISEPLLTEINISSDNLNFASADGVLFNKDMTKLLRFPQGRSGNYTVPDGVTRIEHDAFASCSGLSSVAIPDSVTSIGYMAFYGCSGLTSVSVPDSVTGMGYRAFKECVSLDSVTMGDGLKSISQELFYGCEKLESVKIPSSVTNVYTYPFGNCSQLTLIYAPMTLQSEEMKSRLKSENSATVVYYGVLNPFDSTLNGTPTDEQLTAVGYNGVYDGQEHGIDVEAQLSSEAKALNPTITYSDKANGEYIAENYLYTDVVTASVWYKVKSEDYMPFVTNAVVKIAPRDISNVTVGTIAGQVYTGSTIKPSVTVTDVVNGKSIIKASDYTVSYSGNVNAGTATVTLSGKGNYDGTKTVTFVITKKQVAKPTADTTVYVYDGNEKSYVVAESEYYTVSGNKRTDAGSQEVVVALKDKANFAWADGTTDDVKFTFTIAKRPVTITSPTKSKAFDGTALTFTADEITATGYVDGEKLAYSGFASQTAVGSIEAAFTVADSDTAKVSNYDITLNKGTLTVTKASVVPGDGDGDGSEGGDSGDGSESGGDTEPGNDESLVVPADGISKYDVTAEYDGKAHTINTNAIEAITLVGATPKFTYGLTKEGPWVSVAPAWTDVVTTSVWYRISADNYDDYVHEAKVTITARPITITSPTKSKAFDGTALTFTADEITATGYVDGEKLAYSGFASQTAVGSIEAAFTVADSDTAKVSNYDITLNKGTLTVTKASVVPGDGDGDGSEGGDSGDGSESGGDTEPGDDGSLVVPEDGISKYDVTATYDGKAHTINTNAIEAITLVGATPKFTYGLTKEGPWVSVAPAWTDVVTTSVWYRISADNYDDYVHEAKVTITARNISNVTVDAIADQDYTGSAIEPPVTVTDGNPSIVKVSDYDVSYANNVNVGTATITLTGKGNYTGTKDVTFVIKDNISTMLSATLDWRYSSGSGTYYARLQVTKTGNSAIRDLAFIFADRTQKGKAYAQLWNTSMYAPVSAITTLSDGTSARYVSLDPSKLNDGYENYGVSAATMQSTGVVPAAERLIELYVRKRVSPVSGNETNAEVDNFIGYLRYTVEETDYYLPIVAGNAQNGAIASQKPASIATMNLASALNVPAAASLEPICEIDTFNVGEDEISGTFTVKASANGSELVVGTLGGNVTVKLLGAKELGAGFTELNRAVVSIADKRFSFAKPGDYKFFKVKLEIGDVYE